MPAPDERAVASASLFPSRREFVARLTLRLQSSRVVAVRSAPGMGLTSVLRGLGEHAGGYLVSGSHAVRDVPLVPLAPLLHSADRQGGVLDSVAALAPVLGARSPVIVDDAHLLDDASAAAIAQAYEAGASVVCGAPMGSALPVALESLVRSGAGNPTVVLPRASDEELLGMVTEMVGGPLTEPAAQRVCAVSDGTPGLAQALLEVSPHHPVGACVSLGEPRDSARILELAGFSPEELAAHRDVAEVLAVVGGLNREDVERHVGAAAFDRAVRAGVVAVDDGVAQPASVALGAALLADVPTAARRALAARLSETTSDHRAAALARGAGGEALPMIEWLLGQGREAEAAAVGQDLEGFDRCIAQSLARQARGDLPGALAAADQAVEEAATEQQLLDATRRFVDLIGGGPARYEQLRARVESVARRLDGGLADEVRAALERRAALLGLPPRSDGGSRDLVASMLRGSLDAAPRQRDSAVARTGLDDLASALLDISEVLGIAYDGDFRSALTLQDQRRDAARRTLSPTLALWSYNRSKFYHHGGQPALAVQAARTTVRQMAWRDVAGHADHARALLAACLARTGRLGEAERWAADIPGESRQLPRVNLGLAKVRAERIRADGRAGDAATHIAEAARYAIECGEGYSGLLAMDEALMLDPTHDRVKPLADVNEPSPLVLLLLRRGCALVDGDVEALEASAEEFESRGLPGRAAHAWTAAENLHASRGDQGRALTALSRAQSLLIDEGASPWPLDTPVLALLTPREREVCRRAAGFARSRAIAEELGLSVRTVDNHLSSAYRKLGVSGREELAAVVGAV